MPASATRKTAKKKVSSAKTWKRHRAEELELPSGEVALVKRPGPELFLRKGLLPDSLTPIIQESIRKGRGLPPEKMQSLIGDENGLLELMDSIDKVTVEVVQGPKVHYHKWTETDDVDELLVGQVIPEDERDPDEYIYTDEVELDDKMFIFNFAVGGTRDLERFRSELSDGVGDLHAGAGDEGSALGTRSGATGAAEIADTGADGGPSGGHVRDGAQE